MVPCSPDTLGTGTRRELGVMRGPHQTFSPGTGAGAEHRGYLTSPIPQPKDQPKLSERNTADSSPDRWPSSPPAAAGARFSQSRKPCVPGEGGNHDEKRFRCCPRSTVLPRAALGRRVAPPSWGALRGREAQPLGRGAGEPGGDRQELLSPREGGITQPTRICNAGPPVWGPRSPGD